MAVVHGAHRLALRLVPGPRVWGPHVRGSLVWDPHVSGVCVVHGWSVAARLLAGGQGQKVAAGSSGEDGPG